MSQAPARFALWLLLAIGTAGTTFFVIVVIAAGRSPPAKFWLWPVFCLAATVLSIWKLRSLERQGQDGKNGPRAHLYVSDLLTVSIAMALYLTVVKAWAPIDFDRFGLWGGAAVLGALILALLHASRRGFARGFPRGAYALGSALTIIGMGGMGLLLSLSALTLVTGEFSNFLDWLLNGPGDSVLRAGVAGMAALAVGQLLCRWARKRKEAEAAKS